MVVMVGMTNVLRRRQEEAYQQGDVDANKEKVAVEERAFYT